MAPVTFNQWSHVVGTYDGATAKLYINGALVASTTVNAPITHSANSLMIGQGPGSTNYTWNGSLDEVALYGSALSAAQILQHYNAGVRPLTFVDVELVRDGDPNYSYLIADNAYNNGEVNWLIPGSIPEQSDYRIRVTRSDNGALVDLSNNTFSITPPISIYYVNLATDANFTDNEDPTAAGNDANSGLSPSSPKASIIRDSAGLRLGPRRYDCGGHGHLHAVVKSQRHSQRRGSAHPRRQQAGHASILNRGNTNAGSYVMELVMLTTSN